MNAAQALADLTEISAQIEAAVMADDDGSVVASTFDDESRTEKMARTAAELLAAADEVRGEGMGPVHQLEVASTEGSVFVVRDERHIVAAVTRPRPTVGLVFYDLRSCLRLLDEGEREPKAGARRSRKKEPDGES
jgi:predicted regulator of Ras-like GTPase activity (Roadblock/LC7/MglB family)